MTAMYSISLKQGYIIHVSWACFDFVFAISQNRQPSEAKTPASIVS